MADRCDCAGCKDRRFFLNRIEEFKRMAEASVCVKETAKRIVEGVLNPEKKGKGKGS